MAKKEKRYTAHLRPSVGYPGLGVPGSGAVITKRPTVIMEAQRDALLSAMKKGKLPLGEEDVIIEEVNEADSVEAASPQASPPEEPKPLDEQTVEDLRKVASEAGVTGYSSLTKDKLIEAIRKSGHPAKKTES